MKKNIKKKAAINKSMKFIEIMEYPEAMEILFKKGLHCVGCEMASFETLEQGCIMHGLNPDKVVDEINKKISKKSNKKSKENDKIKWKIITKKY
jgi:hybrid cluster-associated redox disulfide protein